MRLANCDEETTCVHLGNGHQNDTPLDRCERLVWICSYFMRHHGCRSHECTRPRWLVGIPWIAFPIPQNGCAVHSIHNYKLNPTRSEADDLFAFAFGSIKVISNRWSFSRKHNWNAKHEKKTLDNDVKYVDLPFIGIRITCLPACPPAS